MHQKTVSINRIFLHSLQIIGMVGSLLVLAVDLRNGFDDRVSVYADLGVFFSVLAGFVISKFYKKDTLAVVVFTSMILVVMTYLFCNSTGYFSGISLIIFIVLGYLYSLMLKGSVRIVMQVITISLLLVLLVLQYLNPSLFTNQVRTDLFSSAAPYIIVYITIAATAAVLKDRLDNANDALVKANDELNEKNREIETQNEELNSQQEELNSMNAKLEELVENRTLLLLEKNKQLRYYAFRNAHNVRGSLARVLGLLLLNKVDSTLSDAKILEMIEKEAHEMDAIVREIAHEIGENEEEG